MADGTPTANYGWTKPIVGASVDQWGTEINADLDGIDSAVKGVSTVANAAYPTSNPSGFQTAAQVTASLGNYLPLAGGTLTGNLNGTAATFSTSLGVVNAVGPAPLKLDGATATQRSLQFRTSGAARWFILADPTAESAGSGSNLTFYRFNDAGTLVDTPISIARATGVTTFSQPIVNGSDRRLKTDIQPIADALAIVQKLQGVRYKPIDGDKTHVGLIAQDVAPHLPEVVFETSASPPQVERLDLSEGEPVLGVAYGNVVAVLIEAVKELSAKVTELEMSR